MKKMKWTSCDAHHDPDTLIQIWEFIRVPDPRNQIHEIRIFFDLFEEDYYRTRKNNNGTIEWFHTSIYTVEEAINGK